MAKTSPELAREATGGENSRRVPAAALLGFATEAFRACGLPPADAAIVAGAVIEADLAGSDAHGVFRLTQYVRSLREGRVNPRPNLEVIKCGPGTAIVDGDTGMGHLARLPAVSTLA